MATTQGDRIAGLQRTIEVLQEKLDAALAQHSSEYGERMAHQAATIDVLKAMSASPGDPQPVFELITRRALEICGAAGVRLVEFDGSLCHLRALVRTDGLETEADEALRQLYPSSPDHVSIDGRVIFSGTTVHVRDASELPTHRRGRYSASVVGVPLLRHGRVAGAIVMARPQPGGFSEAQIELLKTFAEQAAIAITSAVSYRDLREALQQQTATAEVLQVINSSPGDLAPVFDAMLEKAMRLCAAAFGFMTVIDGERSHTVAARGVPAAYAAFRERNPTPANAPIASRIRRGEPFIHTVDLKEERFYGEGDSQRRAIVDLGGARTLLAVPLMRDQAVLGAIQVYRIEVRPFSDKQIALLQNFAAQAVIAIENARLLDEIRQRQAELRVTFENMGDGVAMFDETQHLVAWNRKFQDILDVPDDIIARRQTFSEYVRYLADRGEYGHEAQPEEHVRRLIEQAGQARTYERIRPAGRVIEIRHNPVAGGGFVLIYADITERKRNEAKIRAARDAAEEASRTIEAAFRDLRAVQANLIQAEKMASLGQLTAGIAHEIKNPLNFVNNFAALSVDLLSELKETAAPGFAALTDDQRAEIDDVSDMLTSNLEKITEHGKRADGIVKAMLEHSRGSSAERRMVDLNGLIDEALNLAYHGARAQDQRFNITLEREFGEGVAPILVNPQDMTRVFLNIFSNGFYAAMRRAHKGGDTAFVPMLKVTTRDAGEVVEIRVRDNGTGIPAEIRDKLFQPFFTTKPTGEGTGLGLSITYDIVTKQHGGTIAVESEVDAFTEFVLTLPRQMFAADGGRA